MNRLLLLRPISRSVRVQRPITCYRHPTKSFSSTTCRKFGSSSIKRTDQKNPPPPAGAAAQETLLESEAVDPGRRSQLQSQSRGTAPSTSLLENSSEVTSEAQQAEDLPDTRTEAEKWYESWNSPAVNQALQMHNINLGQYFASLMQLPEVMKALSDKITPAQAKLFEDLWMAVENSEEDSKGHSLVTFLLFFLKRGVQFLPPNAESMNPANNVVIFEVEQEAWMTEEAEDQQEPTKPTENAVTFPDLRMPSPLLDPRDVYELPPTEHTPYHNRVIIRNHRSVFHEYPPDWETGLAAEDGPENKEQQGQQDEFFKSLPVSSKYFSNLHQAILMRRSVVQQTGKGKIRRISYMVLVGDGNGLVGYGQGKHSNARIALRAAQLSAVKNMDWVERFEKRTIWTEMETKYGATHLILRPRPVGFGLRCNPYLHQILRAAGLKDVSAKVWGSRNKLNVIKAVFRVIHAGHAPTSMGDGIGGKGMKQSKGVGIRSMTDVERARGRKLISLRR